MYSTASDPAQPREPTLTERLQENLNVLNSIQDDAHSRLSGLYVRMFGHQGADPQPSGSKLQAVASTTAGELSDSVQSAINRANIISALIADLGRAL